MKRSAFVSTAWLVLVAHAAIAEAQLAPQRISAGANHTCAKMSDGSVRCWGNNDDGQLGNGTTSEFAAPAPVVGLSAVTDISAGAAHTCALLNDRTVRCWGVNTYGQLGDGTVTPRLTPIVVSGLSDAIALAASQDHTCALLSTGTIRCWGLNSDGQLGDGTHVERHTPVTVQGISAAVALDLGAAHSCALRSTGGVSCWGYNGDGQLGNGGTVSSSAPVAVSALSSATAIALGWDHSCALSSGGSLKCWGFNAVGEVGDGTTAGDPGQTGRLVPVSVIGIASGVRLAAGYDHSCVALSGGGLRCWGSNLSGEIGDGTLDGDHSSPTSVLGITGSVSDLTVGQAHTCALQGTIVRCWGGNFLGQLGTGTVGDPSLTPVAVPGLGTQAVPAASSVHLLLLLTLLLAILTTHYRQRRVNS